MNKTIQELATEMTREEFLKYTSDKGICPIDLDLKITATICDNADESICAECMEKAVEHITFKQPLSVMEEYLPVLEQLQEAEMQYKQLDERRKKLKEQLQDIMETHGITKWENDEFSISYVAEGKPSTTLDSAAVKKKYPMVYEECSKSKAGAKAYVKFNLKGGK